MNLTERKTLTGPLVIVALFISVVATLRYAQELFLPLVFAGLLSFLLSPLVRRLERWHLGRIGAVLVTATLTFVLIGALTYLVTSQFLDLAGSLPKYRANLIARVTALKTSENNPLRLAVRTISEVTAALNKEEAAARAPAATDKARPTRVEVVETADGSVRMLMSMLWPVVGPLGNAAVVIVIAIFMLLAGQDLRDRLIHLLGRGRLRMTTQALDDIAHRIRAYLRALLLINASFGLAIGVGLYFIGIPNAVFWGLLAMVLRFLPYIGPWLAAAFPVALSMAVFGSWTQPLLVIGLFVVCELISNNVIEPWPYGTSTEISPLAVIVSALFWTWLWGGVGLVLATPLTVCLAVAGKYLPGLSFLDLLLGDKPSISPGDRLYQRLLALNEEDAGEIIEKHTREQSALSAFDDAVIPALRSIEADFRAGVLSDVARTDACHMLRQIITDLAAPIVASDATNASVLCIPASHEGDELAALMLAQVLAESGVAATVFSSTLLAGESIEQAAALAPSIVCISSLPPVSTIAARTLCKRLRARLPSARILVGLWQPDDAEFTARRMRLGKAGADETYPDLRRAAAAVVAFAACTLPPGTDIPAPPPP
ncbi:ABC transporter permease [Verrucomicrobiota bacterium]|nr:ABC transporter permease [Verrucomicrobiota bacterium]